MIRRHLKTVGTLVGITLLATAVPVALNMADAAGPNTCSGNFAVNEVLANGARWQMCWERRSRGGDRLPPHHLHPAGRHARGDPGPGQPGGDPRPLRQQLRPLPRPVRHRPGRELSMLDADRRPTARVSCWSTAARNVMCQNVLDNGYEYKSYDAAGTGHLAGPVQRQRPRRLQLHRRLELRRRRHDPPPGGRRRQPADRLRRPAERWLAAGRWPPRHRPHAQLLLAARLRRGRLGRRPGRGARDPGRPGLRPEPDAEHPPRLHHRGGAPGGPDRASAAGASGT